MKVVIQRVKKASVKIDGDIFSSINCGLLIFVGFGEKESKEDLKWIAKKIISLRVFSDNEGKMNKSIQDINGDALVVSQFTLAADTSRGNRPGFSSAAPPEKGEKLYEYFTEKLQEIGIPCQMGVFGGDMKISLVNDGPTTIWMEN